MSPKIALVDDHVLLRNGLSNLIKENGYEIAFEADNGVDLTEKIKEGNIPDIVLLDINMPHMDGYEAALWLKVQYPDIKVLALSMNDDENAIIRMIRNGAKGYLLKDSDPSELRTALTSVVNKGYYHSDLVTGKLIHSLNNLDHSKNITSQTAFNLSEKEVEFLKFTCTEMTYKEIADKMCLSPRTIDGYRDALFEKLNLKSRVGLVIFAIKNGIVKV